MVCLLAMGSACSMPGGSSASAETPAARFLVAYNANGGSGSVPIDTGRYQAGSPVTVLGNTGGLASTGRVFAGWNTLANGSGTSYAAGAAFTMGAADVTLYALWTVPAYRVIYRENGGSGSAPIDPGEYPQGAIVTVLGNTTNMVKSGNAFAGWNTMADGTGATSAAGDTMAIATHDITLHAVWVPAGLTFSSSASAIRITGYTTAPNGALTIPGGVTAVGDNAFLNALALTSISLPSSITSIGQHAFDHCSALASIIIPAAVTTIADHAFSSCSALASVTIPDGVTSIGAGAFEGCTHLVSITLPAGVTSIGAAAFNNCSNLAGITLPPAVTTIPDYLFGSCGKLQTVTLPASLTSVGLQAFAYCTVLTSLALPAGVTSIAGYAFEYCTTLTSINIPDGVTGIGTNTFQDCSALASITIPASVTSIGNCAFQHCTSLLSVTVLATTPPTVFPGSNPFLLCPPGLQIRVPAACVSAYKSAPGWNAFASQIVGF
jgi:hypothetical protein